MSVNTEEAQAETPEKSASGLAKWGKPLAFIGVLVILFVLAKVFNLGDKLKLMNTWIESLGPMGPIAFIGIYIGATVAAIPGSALTIAAGALFGSVIGTIAVSIGSTLGAAACFLIARYIARDSIESNMKNNQMFQKLDAMTENQGAIIVAITRLVPIFPFNLLNYGFGLTKVSFLTYVLASWICMLPGTILYVVGADAIKTAVAKGEIPWTLVGIVVVAIIGIGVIARVAKSKLKTPDIEPAEQA